MIGILKCFFFFCFALFSCVESDRDRILRQVAEWEGREIVFPARPVFTVQGRVRLLARREALPTGY